jgi:hypothetical protein
MPTIVSIDFRPDVNSLDAPSAKRKIRRLGSMSPATVFVSGANAQTASAAEAGPASVLLVKPERALDYEIDAETASFDRSLILNVNARWADIWDCQANSLQVTPNEATLSLITNVRSPLTRGVEIEGDWRASSALTCNWSVGYNYAHYASFPAAPAVQGAAVGTQGSVGPARG